MTHKPASSPERDARKDGDQAPPVWSGFAEIDHAIAENRLMDFRWKKAWADPWGRRLAIFVMIAFAGFAAFVVYQDVFKG